MRFRVVIGRCRWVECSAFTPTPRSDEMPDKGPGSKSGGKKPKGGKADKKKK